MTGGDGKDEVEGTVWIIDVYLYSYVSLHVQTSLLYGGVLLLILSGQVVCSRLQKTSHRRRLLLLLRGTGTLICCRVLREGQNLLI